MRIIALAIIIIFTSCGRASSQEDKIVINNIKKEKTDDWRLLLIQLISKEDPDNIQLDTEEINQFKELHFVFSGDTLIANNKFKALITKESIDSRKFFEKKYLYNYYVDFFEKNIHSDISKELTYLGLNGIDNESIQFFKFLNRTNLDNVPPILSNNQIIINYSRHILVFGNLKDQKQSTLSNNQQSFLNFYNALPSVKLPIQTKELPAGEKCNQSFLHYNYDKTNFTLDGLKVIGNFEVDNFKFIIYNFSLLGKGEGYEDNIYLINTFTSDGNYLDNLVISGNLGGEGSANIYSGEIKQNNISVQIKEEHYESSTGLNYTVSIPTRFQQYEFNIKKQKFDLLKENYNCSDFNLFYQKIETLFSNSNKNIILNDISLKIKPYIQCNPITSKNINEYNNIAYYLEQSGAYSQAIYLLKTIVTNYPDRVVAWLNLADAQWGLDEKPEAKKSYLKYTSLMKEQKKDLSKIPQRVFDRTK